MIGHPLVIAVLVLDLLALGFALSAAPPWLGVLLEWAPDGSGARQLRLEASLEAASLGTRWAVGLFGLGSLLLLVGVTGVLPDLVPGAMCGTGVLLATEGLGERALALRGFALAALWVWQTLDHLNRAAPRPPAIPLEARWHLLSLPLLGYAAWSTFRALLQLDPHQPVSCCQALYSSTAATAEGAAPLGLPAAAWLALFFGGLVALPLLTALSGLLKARRRALHGALLATALVWLPAAVVTLSQHLAAYHYGVLHHHCPWCLFLGEHHAVGYPLFAALLLIGLEALAGFTTATAAAHHDALAAPAARRLRRSRWVVLGAWLVFALLALGPAIAWRVEHGVWMSG